MPVREWDGPPPFSGKATVIIGGRMPPKGWPKSSSPPEPSVKPDDESDSDCDEPSRTEERKD